MFRTNLAVAAALSLAFEPALAAEPARTFNKEGFWEMHVEKDTCMTAMHIEGGSQLGFFASGGEVSFVAYPAGKAPKGKTGVLAMDMVSFAFTPRVDKASVAMDDVMNDEAVAALRKTRELRVVVEGKLALGVELQGTGFPDALDGLIACSRGEKGWWGEGAQVVEAPKAWEVKVSEDGLCNALALDRAGSAFVLVAGPKGIAAGVGLPSRSRRGRKGVLEIDGHVFDFAPVYDGSDYFSAGLLGEEHVGLLAKARDVRVSVDSREVLNLHVEDTGLDAALARLADCVPRPAGKRN